MQGLAAIAFVSGALLLSGCGLPSNYPVLGRVAGVVALDGQPVEGASVSFFPAQGRPSSASTDAQGRYDLFFVNKVRGAAVGDHRVSINKIVQDPKYVPYPPDQAANDPGPTFINLLPDRYSGTQSELTVVVAKGRNEINFDLKSKE